MPGLEDFTLQSRRFRFERTPLGMKRYRLRLCELELTAAEIERLERAFPVGATAGDRYPDMSTVNR